jgi:TonB-dependent SusC/RagA subfamily outer membrane receptor
MKPIKLILFILSGFVGLMAFHREEFLEGLKAKFNEYARDHAEEKVYVQTDKTFYKPGDDIWLNTFVVDGTSHQATTISDVVYVDLKDPKGAIASSLVLYVQNGVAKGDFHLNDDAAGGIYKLVAHTRWMQNSGEETFFEKELTVQKVVTPRLLLKVDFEKEAYGRGDAVTCSLSARDLKDQPLPYAQVTSTLRIGGHVHSTFTRETDNLGKLQLTFNLPDSLSVTDGILQMIITANGQQESITRSVPIVLNKIDLAFFPEGGDLISDVEGNVAFKATNEFGKGADVSGLILDDKDNTVATFSSFHMGMGAFRFTPRAGHAYRARIVTPAGNNKTFPLPLAIASGYALNLVSHSDESIGFSIDATESGDCFLVGQAHGVIYHAEKIYLNQGTNTVIVNTTTFPSGIAVFTFFNGQGLEEAERLTFLNPHRNLKVTLNPDKSDYAPGEQVKLKIETKDEKGKPVPARLSLSVVDDQLVTFADDKQNNILSWMLLGSELKGDIQEPSFYFDPNEPKATAALDYLMLTHGWRRFTWKNVLQRNRPNVVWLPENNTTLSGKVVNSSNSGTSAEVVLLELGKRRKIARVQAAGDGSFAFSNIDASAAVLLLTRKPNQTMIDGRSALYDDNSTNRRSKRITRVSFDSTVLGQPTAQQVAENMSPDELLNGDLSMDDDVLSLDEVIVTGYAEELRSSLAASVTRVYKNEMPNLPSYTSFESLLQGRVAGVQVQSQSSNAGNGGHVMIRGISSIAAGNGAPLYVIDGVPIGTELNNNFTNGGLIAPENISSVQVLHNPQAAALFGSAASNGAILITTKNGVGYAPYIATQKTTRYSSLLVSPRKFSVAREFPAFITYTKGNNERSDLRSTVYWNGDIITDANGVATVKFYNNEATSAFRITAEGISVSGLPGRTEKVYSTSLPLSLDTKIPNYLGFEDTLRLPVMVRNTRNEPMKGKLVIEAQHGLRIIAGTEVDITVKPSSTATYRFPVVSEHSRGDFKVHIKLTSGSYNDQLEQTISVHPVGYPQTVSFSGKELHRTMQFTIDNDIEQGSLQGGVTLYTDVLTDLAGGVEGIFAEPHGCFEQVSSYTFPNILALQFLEKTGELRPDVRKKALSFIASGYKQLMAYEIKNGGFEWFGSPPAHEALTAYGLIEFYEMKKVYQGVSDEMVRRTRDWLLSKRQGDGTFAQEHGQHGFASASPLVNNAYIVYALAETGTTSIGREYQTSLAEAWQSRDMYRMALMANAALSLNKSGDAEKLIAYFKEQALANPLDRLKMAHSISWSSGNSLAIETVSMWCSALLRATDRDMELIQRCIQFILSTRSYGMFGSTQGTLLALKALTEYATMVRGSREGGEATLLVNNKMADTQLYTSHTNQPIVMQNFLERLTPGDNKVVLNQAGAARDPLPYSVNVTWNTKRPANDKNCKVDISTTVASKVIKVNETTRFVITLQNKTSAGVPMTIALVGIPAGLSLQPWQLKELQDKGVFDYYEIIGDRLALYYRELGPNAKRIINLDLKAEVPGKFTGTASCAYLYYTAEAKNWCSGSTVVIE